MKTRSWILLLAGVLVLCAVFSLLLLLPGEQAGYARVYSEGRLLYTLDLSRDRELTVTTETGENVITVKDGSIAVTRASCPDGYCRKRGFCSSGAQIVCLPNKLVIQFVGEPEIDGVVG